MNRDLPETAMLRIPPHSSQAEQSVIGALLLDGEAINRIHLAPEAFYGSDNAAIFRAIQSLAAAGKPFDPVTVYDEMGTKGEEVGGLAYIMSLAQMVPSAGSIRRHAEIVSEKWQLRQLVTAGDEIAAMGFESTAPAVQLDKAQMLLAKLATVRRKREPQHINQSIADYLGLLQDLSEGKNPAIPTGIGGLDRILNGGIRRGEMMVIGARPKHGKTALALNLARNMARDYSVLFISQEMPVFQLMHRHTAAMGSVDLGRILRADASDAGMWECVNEAAHRLGKLNLIHDDQSAQSLMDIRRKAIQVKRQHGLDVLVVDFLQLMQGAGGDENRNRELDVIVNGIKALSLDLEIGVIVLSQMTRKADEFYRRPTMTHLRDSGAIEAAADQIALLFTDHAHPLSKKADNFAGFSELEIVAHRNGPQGLVPLHFAGAYQQFGDWDGPVPQQPQPKQQTRGMNE
jgi:replicative DNA helicase